MIRTDFRSAFAHHLDSLWLRIWASCGINQHQATWIFFFFHTCSSSYSYWHFKLQLKFLKTWIWTRIRIRIEILRPLLACNYPPIISQKWSQNFNRRLSTWWTRTPSRQPYWWECFECEISTSGNGSIQTRTWNSPWRQPLIENLRPLLAGNLFTLDWFF